MFCCFVILKLKDEWDDEHISPLICVILQHFDFRFVAYGTVYHSKNSLQLSD